MECVSANVDQLVGDQASFTVSATYLGNDWAPYMTWLSDIDGELGYGQTITRKLSPGKHTISAYYDSDAMPTRMYQDKLELIVREHFCVDEKASVATHGDAWTTTRFVNTNKNKVFIYWNNYETAERYSFGSLESGESVEVYGYPGNQWVVADQYNNCAMTHTSQSTDSNILISFDE